MNCRGGFINARSTLHNIMRHDCIFKSSRRLVVVAVCSVLGVFVFDRCTLIPLYYHTRIVLCCCILMLEKHYTSILLCI